MNNEIEFDHFKDINDLLKNIDSWYREDDIEYTRWFGLEDLHILEIYITSLQQKVEQLENIRKEAIEYIENNTKYYDANYSETYRELCSIPGANDTRLHVVVGDTDLLNILNKGSEEK